MSDGGADGVELVERMQVVAASLRTEIGKVVVGQAQVVDMLLASLLAGGHTLLIGVPGLAKTLLINGLARATSLRFNRVQFTPDLMPSDITGTDILDRDAESGARLFRFVPGPVFANILLADEINRATPKTQSALLQAMQETAVTTGGRTHPLEPPFLVFATQNPIEQEGTYPLPEAQLDRFLFSLVVEYPSHSDEVTIARATLPPAEADIRPVVGAGEVIRLQRAAAMLPVSEPVADWAVRLVRLSRPGPSAPGFVNEWLRWGAGPRASHWLVRAARALAMLDGRFSPGVGDVRAAAPAVLRHRLIRTFQAEAEGVPVERIVERLIDLAVEGG